MKYWNVYRLTTNTIMPFNFQIVALSENNIIVQFPMIHYASCDVIRLHAHGFVSERVFSEF